MTDESNFGPLILTKAAQDVRLLLAHVTREGKSFEAAELIKLLTYADKAAAGLTASEEGEFWKLYADLIKLALPARIDSLYFADYAHALGATSFKKDDAIHSGLKKHEQALRYVRRMSIWAFSLTLIILAYLSITESLTTRDVELGREYQILSQGEVAGTTIETTANKILSGSIKTKDAGGSAEDGASQLPAGEKAQVQNQQSVQGLISARQTEIRQLVSANDSLLRNLQLTLYSDGAVEKKQAAVLPYDVVVVSAQKNINSILSNFILPTIAAILGVSVFLLRTASTRVQELSFRSNDAGVYWHRLVLGVVGGIAISWFTATDKTGLLSSIAPAALAFLIGYSVEILYNVLDSLVKALGGAKQ